MELFGIGILEILAVFLLMAIIFGPDRLPEMARQFGRAVRELREYARDFRDEYLTDFEEVKEEYLEVRYELKQADSDLRAEMEELDSDLRKTVQDSVDDAETAVQEAKIAAEGSGGEGAVATAAAKGKTETATDETKDESEQPRRARRVRPRRRQASESGTSRPGKVISINRRRPRA